MATARWMPQAMSHTSQTHRVRCSHKDLGTSCCNGHHLMGQRAGALVTQVALQCAMWGGITPGCWRHFIPCTAIAVSRLSPLIFPHPRAGTTPTRTWHCPFIHQDLGTGVDVRPHIYHMCGQREPEVGTAWAQCGTGTCKKVARACRWQSQGSSVGRKYLVGMAWAWDGVGMGMEINMGWAKE